MGDPQGVDGRLEVSPVPGLTVGEDGVPRCWWAGTDPLYLRYHDAEWGRPIDADGPLFEKLCLEGFQAGLSWLTILRKRENFRAAFAGFDPAAVARFSATDVARLMGDTGIVRNRAKIESTINNAGRCGELVGEFGSLARYVWGFEPHSAVLDAPDRARLMELTKTGESAALSKDLKRRGWSFVGPTTVYAFMQAVGLVNDHLEGCAARAEVERQRQAFTRPKPADM
ncbi:MAG: DNA-3-methyladenine glycosylase I [Candidatus Nephthysia bennettiae]|uniref:DNA-3-methyladenine glycosylase I n=1 Tax=Candidatus Nephthysia bennettiae TaxID=3127016 RepID=A0A934KDU0_9BACT|nr:DNA-3-methyladenine glycosylase I [Candidatus Dormibacteraeota bacterium]MBJ7613785.1 DNA-3-methyladenine glycosylase I [Candidatus Dormibacteraeota bacterium]PZR95552.1 MAG: DNA-3-methyladenine glycosylase I [Candidatus Dormibacteraeota bacterium]